MHCYIDTEFNKYRRDLLTLGLVTDTGNSLYLIMQGALERAQAESYNSGLIKAPEGVRDSDYLQNLAWLRWNVLENVMKLPEGVNAYVCHNRYQAWQALEHFLGQEPAHLISDWPSDFEYFCALITDTDGKRANLGQLSMEVKFVDSYPTVLEGAVQHNAMWDALALRQRLQELTDLV